jgi:hypothetical protein
LRSRLIAVASLLCACGGAPPAAPEPPEPTPAARAAPIHPHILEAPPAVQRWEPSGAAIRGDKLWVVNDRGGWLVAYDLPLKAGINKPTAAHEILPKRLDPVRTEMMARALAPKIAKILAQRLKFEGLAPDGEKGLLLLEAISRTVWRCADPEGGCPTIEPVDIQKSNARLESLLPVPVAYYSLEGVAGGAKPLLATRGLMPENANDDDFRPWAIVVDGDGEATYDGTPLTDAAGRKYGISDIARDGDTLWMTWSYEVDADQTTTGVAGLLARAEIDPKTGLPGPARVCAPLVGKPEGLAVHGDDLVVVFDNDKARKAPGDATRFELTAAQDFARVVPKPACK